MRSTSTGEIADAGAEFAEAYRIIRERMAAGGPGWTPKSCGCRVCLPRAGADS
jgi:hypothetical protein